MSFVQNLVQIAAESERKRLREERRIKRALDDKFPTANNAPDEVFSPSTICSSLRIFTEKDYYYAK